MAVPVLIPKATLTLEEATVLGWKKAAGAFVRKGEALLEIETDKVVLEIPSPADGYLLEITVAEGPAKVEQAVGWIGALDDKLDERGTPASSAAKEAAAEGVKGSRAAPPAAGGVEFSATPAARRRARELGLDLSKVQGTGPGGRVTEKDVEAATGSGPEGGT